MLRIVMRGGTTAVALLMACNSTATCDCPPSRTTAVVYGEVRTAAGAPAASAVVRFFLAPPTGSPPTGDRCDFAGAMKDADPAEMQTDAAGRFRTQISSVFGPATRCLRVTAHAAGAGSASAGVDGLLLAFSFSEPDSVGVVLTLR